MGRSFKLFGISGSPRIAATTWIIQEALRYAEEKWNAETRYFSVRGKKLNFCIHCDHCIKEGGCIHDDAMKEVYSGFEWADAILIGTPVYQGTLSGQAKVVLDRMRAFAASKPHALRGKVGAAVADGGDRIGGQELAIRSLIDFYFLKFYKLLEEVKEHFPKVSPELGPNAPFLSGKIQLGTYDFVLIAPATANTVAKIAYGIADSLITNSAAQAMKADVPVYILPVDQKEGEIVTKLPNGRDLKLRMRKEDVENVEKLRRMRGITALSRVGEIEEVVESYG